MLATDGSSSCSSSSRFGATSMFKLVTPVTLPPGRLRLPTSPTSTGSAPVPKTTGISRVAALATTADAVPQHGHSIANQPCRKLRQPAGVRLRPPIFDLDVLALYIARRTQALAKGR